MRFVNADKRGAPQKCALINLFFWSLSPFYRRLRLKFRRLRKIFNKKKGPQRKTAQSASVRFASDVGRLFFFIRFLFSKSIVLVLLGKTLSETQ